MPHVPLISNMVVKNFIQSLTLFTNFEENLDKAQKNITDCITKAKADLDAIISLYGEVNWKTQGASIAFKKSLDESRTKIDTAMKEVTKIINEQIDESDKAMAESEDSSTVKGSKA